MSLPKKLVLDANILLRAVFGTRVNSILESYEDSAQFCTPDVYVEDARRHILEIAASRRVPPADSQSVLDKLAGKFLYVVDRSFYDEFEEPARARISARDISDWPVVATALLLNSPIWTKTKTFLEAGSPRGQPVPSSSICAMLDPDHFTVVPVFRPNLLNIED